MWAPSFDAFGATPISNRRTDTMVVTSLLHSLSYGHRTAFWRFRLMVIDWIGDALSCAPINYLPLFSSHPIILSTKVLVSKSPQSNERGDLKRICAELIKQYLPQTNYQERKCFPSRNKRPSSGDRHGRGETASGKAPQWPRSHQKQRQQPRLRRGGRLHRPRQSTLPNRFPPHTYPPL